MFSSLNFGTCTKPGGRLVIKALLKALDEGIGHGITALYPISIFKLKAGINYNPGDPNYDLFMRAIEVTAKRQFPNYSNLDAPYNLQYYKEGHPETEVAYMGCAAPWERVKITFPGCSNGYVNCSLEEFYNEAKNKFAHDVDDSDKSCYIPLNGYKIYDLSLKKFVTCKGVLRNPDKGNWFAVRFEKGRVLTLTEDHPLDVKGKGRTAVRDIKEGDEVLLEYVKHLDTPEFVFQMHERIISISRLSEFHSFSYDVETASDRFSLSGVNSHNCRTRVLGNVNGPEIVTDRGNLSFTTLNLPRYAIKAKLEHEKEGTDILDAFYKYLDEAMDLAREQLWHRFRVQCNRRVYNFPYVMQQGAYMGSEYLQENDKITKALYNGTLSFGFVGLAECLTALTGHDHADGEEYQKLGLEIVSKIRNYLDNCTDETHMNWSLIATPAESVAGTLLRKDKAEFGIIPGVTDKDYYTNSNHIPVGKKLKASEKIKLEAPYHALCNAGHILYIEVDGDPTQNLEALQALIRLMHDSGAGYFSFNSKMDCHTSCGYVGIIDDVCPGCGQKESATGRFIRPRRVTGYLSYLDRFNSSKEAEAKDRVTHV